MRLVGCACVLYFPSFIHLKNSAPPSKEGTPAIQSYCGMDLVLSTFPGCSRNQTAVFPVNPFPALKLESRGEAAAGLHMTSPHHYLAKLHAYVQF